MPAGEQGEKKEPDTSLVNAEAVRELKREARGGMGGYELRDVKMEDDVGEVEIQADRNEVLEGERAGEEIFRSIFGEESDEDE